VVRLVGRDDVMDRLVYTATNPVKGGLVDRVDHWPGVNGLRPLLTGRCLRAVRPRHFFRRDGAMPDAVELRPSLAPAQKYIGCGQHIAQNRSIEPVGGSPVVARAVPGLQELLTKPCDTATLRGAIERSMWVMRGRCC
jgi:hypothetical protein